MKGVLGLALVAAVTASPIAIDNFPRDGGVPVVSYSNAKVIPNSYIVKFKDHVKEDSATAHHGWVHDLHTSIENRKTELRKRSEFPILDDMFRGLKHTYNIAGDLLGYSGHFDDEVIEQIRRHPDVAYIEKDQEVHTLGDDEPELETNAPWGLARISHRDSLTLGTFSKYMYSHDGGEGVDVYVIDTGTYVDHVDFEKRAHWSKTVPEDDEDKDGNGHGTHCSGTIAGRKYGVAKKANIYAIKVLRSNGSGSMSDVVAGVEHAVKEHLKQKKDAKDGKRKGFKGSAANMSLGGGKSPLLDQAVNAAVDAGIHFAVAAGNDNADSCDYSPASAENAVTVGASTLPDQRAYFSNYGPCNDIFAPGLNIQSTWIGSNISVNVISGTSMASPHIAGLLAYMLSLQPSEDSDYSMAKITPKELKASLIEIGTVGVLTDVPSDTANVLAWNGGGASNYTDIVDKGGYDAGSKKISVDFGMIKDEVIDETKEISAEIGLLAKKIEDFVGLEAVEIIERIKAELQETEK